MVESVALREDIARAFESVRVDFTGVAPEDFLGFVRKMMDGYGGADPVRALEGISLVPVNIAGIGAEWSLPADIRSNLRIIYVHGGGWTSGGLTVARPVASAVAKEAGCAVLALDYRLAPEHPYPAAVDDCVAGFRWTCENGPYGPGRAPVCMFGDSAGANLVTVVTMRAIEKGMQRPSAIALLSGALDLTRTDYVPRHDPLIAPEAMTNSYQLYTQGKVPVEHPEISVTNVSRATLEQFPPTLIQASTDEFLLAGSRRMADRLIDTGCRCVISVWPKMPHSWHLFLDALPEAKLALAETAAFLLRYR